MTWQANFSEGRTTLIPKPILLLTTVFTVILMTLLACAGEAPTSEPTETRAPSPIAAATSLPATTPAPTETPSPTETPTAGPTATPTIPPIPPAPGMLVPLEIQDPQALESSLSDAELACIGSPERLVRTLAGPGMAPREEQAELLDCLEGETLTRLFLAGFLPGPDPLSLETSACVRDALEVIDPRSAMTAGIEDDTARAMAGSMAAFSVTIACLIDEEWERAGPETGMSPEGREAAQCLLSAFGGPGEMAAGMTATGDGDFTALTRAGEECGLDLGPPPQAPVTPPPTPAPTAATPGRTSTPTATSTTLTPTPKATSTAPTPVASPTITLANTVSEIPKGIPQYDRREWKHWTDEDGDCQDARQEVLIAESLEPLTFEDDRQCRVEWGRWWAPYLEHHLGNPGHIDVDHTVPLRNAHLSGGWRWDAAKKEEYANYLEDPAHLAAISARHNRSKGARGPEEWRPPDEELWCGYATDWTEIKERWELAMTPREAEIVMDMLGMCEDPPAVELETLDQLGSSTGQDKTELTVYGSCEEAAAAGEQRIQGSQGGGRGFPAVMVPSARDGVVCER